MIAIGGREIIDAQSGARLTLFEWILNQDDMDEFARTRRLQVLLSDGAVAVGAGELGKG